MKPNDKIKDMVARTEAPRSTFTVQKSEPETSPAADLLLEVSAEETELAAAEEQLKERRAELADKAQKAAEAVRQGKLSEWRQKMDDAADYAEIAKESTDHEKTKDYFRRSKLAEREAAQLAAELNLNVPSISTDDAPRSFQLLSTNKAIVMVIGLFLLFVGLTYFFGAPLASDPGNSMGQSMMNNAPLRALLSFTLTFLTFLVSVFFIRVCFPQLYRIWHNRIDSERSLDTLLNEAPAWAVLLALLGLFYTFMHLFASYYQAMYA